MKYITYLILLITTLSLVACENSPSVEVCTGTISKLELYNYDYLDSVASCNLDMYNNEPAENTRYQFTGIEMRYNSIPQPIIEGKKYTLICNPANMAKVYWFKAEVKDE